MLLYLFASKQVPLESFIVRFRSLALWTMTWHARHGICHHRGFIHLLSGRSGRKREMLSPKAPILIIVCNWLRMVEVSYTILYRTPCDSLWDI